MEARNIITRAMEILKSVKKKSEFDMMLEWEMYNGYDPIFDKQMKGYFAIVNPIENEELRTAMCDIWNATLEFYYTAPKNEECEIEQAISEAQRIKKSATDEDRAIGILSMVKVKTDKGQRVLIERKDGRKILRKLYEAPRKEEMLDFEACQKELIDLAELGSRDYRSAIAALVAKYKRA